MAKRKGIGGHQSAAATTTTWLTPPGIIQALGGPESFDLDPCTPFRSPIRTARRTMSYVFQDGLAAAWDGRVWLNPPYGEEVGAWLEKMADHDQGSALIFARTETEAFHAHVWGRAAGVHFFAGRLHFHRPDGTRAKANAGAPSVLAAYGSDELDRLAESGLPGQFVPLRFPRFAVVAAMDSTWREVVLAYVRSNGGPVVIADLYRALARHPKTKRNPSWRAKVRQTLQRGPFERVAPSTWAATPANA